MEKVKCIEYRGIRDVVAAKILTDTTSELTYDEPFSLLWASELSRETENSSEPHYYDNVPAIVIDSTGADNVNITGSAIPLEVVAKVTGQYFDETTGMFVEGERTSDYYALGYITEDTDGNEVFVWRLKGKFGIPSNTHTTKNDGTDANGQELAFSGINTTHKFTKTGKSARAVNVYASKSPLNEAEFFETVQTPDTISTAATN